MIAVVLICMSLQTQELSKQKKLNPAVKLDYTPHPIKIRPEDIVDEESEDDDETLIKKMLVCYPPHPSATVPTASICYSTYCILLLQYLPHPSATVPAASIC